MWSNNLVNIIKEEEIKDITNHLRTYCEPTAKVLCNDTLKRKVISFIMMGLKIVQVFL